MVLFRRNKKAPLPGFDTGFADAALLDRSGEESESYALQNDYPRDDSGPAGIARSAASDAEAEDDRQWLRDGVEAETSGVDRPVGKDSRLLRSANPFASRDGVGPGGYFARTFGKRIGRGDVVVDR